VGTGDAVLEMNPQEKLNGIGHQIDDVVDMCIKIFKYFAPKELQPIRFADFITTLHHVPAVADWWKHSAF
jgi:hypothetical protein